MAEPEAPLWALHVESFCDAAASEKTRAAARSSLEAALADGDAKLLDMARSARAALLPLL